MRTDFVLLGAGSGAGKTELATQIAKANVEMGRRVHYFALEAEDREIERRILYKMIAHRFFKDPKRPKTHIAYADWRKGRLDEELVDYETDANREFDAKYANLYTIYRKRDFFIEDFERVLLAIKDQTDLIIIDHLNYFDSDDENENRAVTRIMKKIRDLALLTKLPIILVAHIRKKDKFSKAIMPDLEDFMGSSNVYKIPTLAVLLAAAKRDEATSSTHWQTYMRVVKSRIDGSLNRFIGRTTFDSEKNAYDFQYQLGFWKDGLEAFEPISELEKLPRWAQPPRVGERPR
jgi:replicative DNA helicase